MPISPARAAAFEILIRVEQTEAYASELLHSGRFQKLSPVDHGLLTEIVMGVLRWREVLDEKIAEHVSQPLSKLDVEVLTALRIGAYQILFLDRIPVRAAINESVELVKRAGKKSAAGLVNAVLRKFISHPSPKTGETVGQPRTGIGEDYDVRGRPPLHGWSHPAWMVERWEQVYGEEVTRKICEHDQSAPRTGVRISAFAVSTKSEALQLEPGKLLTSAALVTAGDVTQSDSFREHRLVIQDEASQLVALLVGKGKAILDCCAAPGGKIRILAEANPGATVLAVELHPRRAVLLKRLLGDPNAKIVAADARAMPFRILFDRTLVDAPCSGTGTLGRNPEIKWRLKPEDLVRLQNYQIEILSAAMEQVAVGGRIVYSTCSLEPTENEQVIEKVMTGNSDFRLVDARDRLLELQEDGELAWKNIDSLLRGPYVRIIPGVHPCDGFFAAILERKSRSDSH